MIKPLEKNKMGTQSQREFENFMRNEQPLEMAVTPYLTKLYERNESFRKVGKKVIFVSLTDQLYFEE